MTVEVTRGPLVESRHAIHWVVANVAGRAVHGEGDSEETIFLRSAAKPFQAMAVLVGGAVVAFGLTEPEIAIVSGSHHGEPEHLAAVRSILEKSGVSESALQCGAHKPYNTAAARALREAGEAPRPIHNNCSGKHAGLLALAKHLGAPLETYRERGHPTEEIVFSVMAAAFDARPEEIPYGIDGCGLPAGAVSLRRAAKAFARFASSDALPEDFAEAARRLRDAQARYPVMVNGTEGFNTALLQTAPHLVAKSGAEGVFCVGNTRTGEGLALKATDGASRAVAPATVALLLQIGWLDYASAAPLASFAEPTILTVAGSPAGTIRAV